MKRHIIFIMLFLAGQAGAVGQTYYRIWQKSK